MIRTKQCRGCSKNFECGLTNGKTCWCNSLPNILPLSPGHDCLCPVCLKEEIKIQIAEFIENWRQKKVENIAVNYQSSNSSLVEDIDYYIENGKYVFTSWYLLKRGYCCGNGCRHCPYPKS